MKTDAPSSTESLIPCLHSLLHSIRCIAHHEDSVCELLHELHHTKIAQTKFIAELRDLLEDLPAYDFLDDFNDVRDILGQTQIAEKRQRQRKPPKASPARRTQSRAKRKPRKPPERKTPRSMTRKTASPNTRRKSSK
jgi:hypothetical protein